MKQIKTDIVLFLLLSCQFSDRDNERESPVSQRCLLQRYIHKVEWKLRVKRLDEHLFLEFILFCTEVFHFFREISKVEQSAIDAFVSWQSDRLGRLRGKEK